MVINDDNSFVIKIRDLKKVYKVGDNKLVVLENINLNVRKGDIVAIVGRSGSGKSTLLNIVGGLDSPTAGSVEINSIKINSLNEYELSKFRNKHIGFVFQFHHLLMEFTALENIMIPGLILGIYPESTIERIALELLEKLGLTSKKDIKPSKLSGGERQRVAIARALINNPDIVLADEPTGNLDNQTAENTKDLLFEIIKMYRRTMIIVTHNMSIISDTNVKYSLKFGFLNPLLADTN